MLPASTMIVPPPPCAEPALAALEPPDAGLMSSPPLAALPPRTFDVCGALALQPDESPIAALSATYPAQDQGCLILDVMKPRSRDALCVS
jgi:hypothetical protein